MEKSIRYILNESGINFKQEYTFEGCKNVNRLPFDFYLEDLNICIEADGIQHFEPIEFFGGKDAYDRLKINDQIKDSYCKNNGIKLIRIPYFESGSIGNILLKEVIDNEE